MCANIAFAILSKKRLGSQICIKIGKTNKCKRCRCTNLASSIITVRKRGGLGIVSFLSKVDAKSFDSGKRSISSNAAHSDEESKSMLY